MTKLSKNNLFLDEIFFFTVGGKKLSLDTTRSFSFKIYVFFTFLLFTLTIPFLNNVQILGKLSLGFFFFRAGAAGRGAAAAASHQPRAPPRSGEGERHQDMKAIGPLSAPACRLPRGLVNLHGILIYVASRRTH